MGLGTSELLLLAVIAVMFLGPKEVYKIAHKMGGWMREIQKMSQEFMRELNREADAVEREERSQSLDKNVFVTGPAAASPAAPETPIMDSPVSVAETTPMVTDDDPASLFSTVPPTGETPSEPPQSESVAEPLAEPAETEKAAQ